MTYQERLAETLGTIEEAFETMRKRRNEYGVKMLLIGLLAGFNIGVFYTLMIG